MAEGARDILITSDEISGTTDYKNVNSLTLFDYDAIVITRDYFWIFIFILYFKHDLSSFSVDSFNFSSKAEIRTGSAM